MRIYTSEEISDKLKRKNRNKKIINAIIYPIFVLVLICITSLLIQKATNPNEIPNLFGYQMFTIISGSMEPTLNIGDLIIVKNIGEYEIQKGDIISFSESNSIVTHRVTDIVEEEGKLLYQTKGDNNNTNDEKMVKVEDIRGIYKFKIPKIGKIVLYTQNITGLVVVLGMLYFIYLISDEKEKRKASRHEKRKEFEKEK